MARWYCLSAVKTRALLKQLHIYCHFFGGLCHTGLQGGLGVDGLGGEAHFHRQRLADRVREPLRTTCARYYGNICGQRATAFRATGNKIPSGEQVPPNTG
jgi:hypothetical protein